MVAQLIDLARERANRRRPHDLGVGICRCCGNTQVVATPSSGRGAAAILICEVCRAPAIDFEAFQAVDFHAPRTAPERRRRTAR